MSLSLWGQQLEGNRVPAGHKFANAINYYADFRNTGGVSFTLTDFGDFLVDIKRYRPGGVPAWCYPFTPNQLNIATLSTPDVNLLRDDPEGRVARIFLYQWYRCDVKTELPRCLADVFIVGHLRQKGFMVNATLKAEIVRLDYAGTSKAAGALTQVGNGIGKHFGFLDANGLPTVFFNSFFT